MTVMDAVDDPPEVQTTPALFVAFMFCLPVLVCSLGELTISLQDRSPTWLLRTTFYSAMLSWPSALFIAAATLWASQQDHLAVGSKVVLWPVALLALLLTFLVPARVVSSKYVVESRGGSPRLAAVSGGCKSSLVVRNGWPGSRAAAHRGDATDKAS